MHIVGLFIGEYQEEVMVPYSYDFPAERHKEFLNSDDLLLSAQTHGLAVSDLSAIAAHQDEGFVEDGKVGYWTDENPRGKFDWFVVGGRWSGYLKLRQPRRSRWWWLGLGPVKTVDSANVEEIDLADLKQKAVAFVVLDGEWHENPESAEAESSEEWSAWVSDTLDALPVGTRITVIDLHS